MKQSINIGLLKAIPSELKREEMQLFLQNLPQLALLPYPTWYFLINKIFLALISTGGLIGLLIFGQYIFTSEKENPQQENSFLTIGKKEKENNGKELITKDIDEKKPTGKKTINMPLNVDDSAVISSPIDSIFSDTLPNSIFEKPSNNNGNDKSIFNQQDSGLVLNTLQNTGPVTTIERIITKEYSKDKKPGSLFDDNNLEDSLDAVYSNLMTPRRFENLKLNKLKRTLRSSLLGDQLIANKKSILDLKIQKGKIILNGKILSEKFYKKYSKILEGFSIGYGPFRKIWITEEDIAVGDFYKEIFIGIAKGTFEENILTNY